MLLRQIFLDELFATPAGAKFDIRNTLFFNILSANPLLARFYADFFRRHDANPIIIKDLETRSGLFFTPDRSPKNPTTKAAKGSNMAINPNTRACTHIKVNGIRCGSPSLRREVFCYFHQRMIRGVRTPPKSRLHPIAMLEDQESIQASLMEIVNALVRNQIDVPRARLVLRALSIAVRNAGKVRFDCWQNEMVQEIPEYPAAPTVARPFAVAAAQAAALTTITAAQNKEAKSDRRSAFRPAPADVPRTETQRTGVQRTDVPRKPPASVRRMARSRPAARSRAG